MSIYKSPNSPYWQYDFQQRGHRYYGSTGCASKRDAERYEAERRRRAALGETAKPSTTIDQACDAWWLAVGQHYRSHATVLYQLANLAEGLGKTKPLHDIRLTDIDAYIAKRRATVKNASVNRETALLRRVIEWNAARGFDTPRIEWKSIRLKEAAPQTRILADDEEARLFAVLPASLKPIVEFALLSGQRKTEIVTLHWSDVDFPNRRATVWAKGQKPHHFPLTPRLVALIANQPRGFDQVFTYICERDSPPRQGRERRIKGERYPFTPQGWARKWRKALKDARIEGYRFHDNRHTAATRTGSIEAANQLLGHSDFKTTKRYFHTAEDVVRNAMIAGESRNSPGVVVAIAPKASKRGRK